MRKTNLKHNLLHLLIVHLVCLSLYTTPILGESSTIQPQIVAEAAILMDARTGTILYEKNADSVYYPASITKLMTALLAIENLEPTDALTFSQEAIYGIEPGSSHIGMRVGEQITVDQALRGLLLESANEIANGLAESVSGSIDQFGIAMTNRAHELGATNTNFVNPHGLHSDEHYTTAYDMALIMRELYNHPYFLEIMSTPLFQIPPTNKTSEIRYLSQDHGLMNERRNSQLYRSDVIGGKTGFTNEARHTLVTSAKLGDIELIVVILKGEKASFYTDTTQLIDYGFNAYHLLDLHTTTSVLTHLPIYSLKSGELFEAAQADVRVSSDESLLISNAIKLRDISTQLNLPDYLELGIKEESTIGSIDYIYNNEIIASNDLVVSTISYASSPFDTSNPQQSILPISLETLIFIIALTIVLFILFVFTISYARYRRRRRLFRNRKLRFSRTLK